MRRNPSGREKASPLKKPVDFFSVNVLLFLNTEHELFYLKLVKLYNINSLIKRLPPIVKLSILVAIIKRLEV
jgi:hypothetical protein